jgi:hypothetical protein
VTDYPLEWIVFVASVVFSSIATRRGLPGLIRDARVVWSNRRKADGGAPVNEQTGECDRTLVTPRHRGPGQTGQMSEAELDAELGPDGVEAAKRITAAAIARRDEVRRARAALKGEP